MGKRGFSIRAGFEYQDLVCAIKILENVTNPNPQFRFSIECSEALFVDDLTFFDGETVTNGFQIKFHVTPGAKTYSFNSFVEKKGNRGKSQIKKLKESFDKFTNEGANPEIQFITSNAPSSDSYDFGQVISNIDRKFRSDFFDSGSYKKSRRKWIKELNCDDQEFKDFAGKIEWQFNFGSFGELRAILEAKLNDLGFESSKDACDDVIAIVGRIAKYSNDKLSIDKFLGELEKSPRLKERAMALRCAEGEVPSDIDADSCKIATVSLNSIPDFSSIDFVCAEHPVPLPGGYGEKFKNISGTENLVAHWQSFKKNYYEWQTKRIFAVLKYLSENPVDLVIFTHFTFNAEMLGELLEWCDSNETSIVTGFVCIPPEAGDVDRFLQDNRIQSIKNSDQLEEEGATVVSFVLRGNRRGDGIVMKAKSPFSLGKDQAGNLVHRISCGKGWITVLGLDCGKSIENARKHLDAKIDLVVCNGGIHIGAMLQQMSQLTFNSGLSTVRVGASMSSGSVAEANSSTPFNPENEIGKEFQFLTLNSQMGEILGLPRCEIQDSSLSFTQRQLGLMMM